MSAVHILLERLDPNMQTEDGSPLQASLYPSREELSDGQLLGSHLWHTADEHSILLCTGQAKDKYLVAVRFAAEKIPPKVLEEVPAEKPER